MNADFSLRYPYKIDPHRKFFRNRSVFAVFPALMLPSIRVLVFLCIQPNELWMLLFEDDLLQERFFGAYKVFLAVRMLLGDCQACHMSRQDYSVTSVFWDAPRRGLCSATHRPFHTVPMLFCDPQNRCKCKQDY